MKKNITTLLAACALLCAASCTTGKQKEIPHWTANEHGAAQLMVDGKPFIMIAGELHNSSASTEEYMRPLFPRLKAMHLNTVLATVAWEQFEPEEGRFDYSLVDALLDNARQNDLKLVLLWFGTWKNGESSYAPIWVKKDTERFFRVKTPEGKNIETISPFCEAAMHADAEAFKELMNYLSEVDHERTVIMVQPENEVGLFQDMDYNPIALKKYEEDVPKQLIDYIKANKNNLKENLYQAWSDNGQQETGNWETVFGDSPHSKEFFTAWQYASYINTVAEAGKEAYPLPMFVNAWIVQYDGQMPGRYPNGGPVAHVMDIYKACAGQIDLVCPDIYLPDFKKIAQEYHRTDNPLLIPESRMEPGRAFYAFAEHDAVGFAPFAIEDGKDNQLLIRSYETLHELQHLITQYQGSGRMKGFLKYKDEREQTVAFGGYKFRIVYEKNNDPAFGLAIQLAEDEFLFSGQNFRVYVSSTLEDKTAYFLQVWEGMYQSEKWVPFRLLNGDETHHNSTLFVSGRKQPVGGMKAEKDIFETTGEKFTYAYGNEAYIWTPGIYHVKVYTRN